MTNTWPRLESASRILLYYIQSVILDPPSGLAGQARTLVAKSGNPSVRATETDTASQPLFAAATGQQDRSLPGAAAASQGQVSAFPVALSLLIVFLTSLTSHALLLLLATGQRLARSSCHISQPGQCTFLLQKKEKKRKDYTFWRSY